MINCTCKVSRIKLLHVESRRPAKAQSVVGGRGGGGAELEMLVVVEASKEALATAVHSLRQLNSIVCDVSVRKTADAPTPGRHDVTKYLVLH